MNDLSGKLTLLIMIVLLIIVLIVLDVYMKKKRLAELNEKNRKAEEKRKEIQKVNEILAPICNQDYITKFIALRNAGFTVDQINSYLPPS